MAYDKQDSFLLMYTTPDGVTKVNVTFDEDTVLAGAGVAGRGDHEHVQSTGVH